MRQSQIKVGGLYIARMHGLYVRLRVDAIREVRFQLRGSDAFKVVYEVTNVATGCKTTFKSAAKFRCEVFQQEPSLIPEVDPDHPLRLKGQE